MGSHNSSKDKGLQGNEQIEEAIAALQKQPTPEVLAHTLTVLRHRMKAAGELILAVEPDLSKDQMAIQTVTTSDGMHWWIAFSGFEEQAKGASGLQSTFMTKMDQLFQAALEEEKIAGVIINPWNRTIQLDKQLLSIILGTQQ